MASAAPRTCLVLHTILLLTALASFASCGQAIDCRRFVFAPQCRGIIAKRTVSDSAIGLPDALQEQRQWSESIPLDYVVPEYSPVYQRIRSTYTRPNTASRGAAVGAQFSSSNAAMNEMGVRDTGDLELLSPYVKVIHRSEKLPYERK
ncbi:hypothetical protein O3P69_003479 [Scylla paramamosain]|uniref:FZ domain-containing protein n=1 Tax=Scylla paramamosain TaxID=85552 RepID=A0AAW0UHV0_SCYPA